MPSTWIWALWVGGSEGRHIYRLLLLPHVGSFVQTIAHHCSATPTFYFLTHWPFPSSLPFSSQMYLFPIYLFINLSLFIKLFYIHLCKTHPLFHLCPFCACCQCFTFDLCHSFTQPLRMPLHHFPLSAFLLTNFNFSIACTHFHVAQ